MDLIRTHRGLIKHEEDDSHLPWVDKPLFDLVMSFVIVANMIVIAMETDLDKDPNNRGVIWILLELVFVVTFCVEIYLKVKHHTKWWLVQSMTNFLCAAIALLALFDFLILQPLRAF